MQFMVGEGIDELALLNIVWVAGCGDVVCLLMGQSSCMQLNYDLGYSSAFCCAADTTWSTALPLLPPRTTSLGVPWLTWYGVHRT